MGITTLLFANPKFIRASREIKSWDVLADEVERQRLALLEAHLGSSEKRFE
jgi:hypothetical protein